MFNKNKTCVIDAGKPDQFLWKCQMTELDVGTVLEVHEAQRAIFLRDGKAVGELGPGRHTLDDTKLTFLQGLKKILFKKTPKFHCDIYFVNLAVQMAMPWGTRERVNTMLEVEPNKALPLSIGAGGSMNLQADQTQAMTLLNYLVGQGKELDRNEVQRIFSGLMSTKIKSYLGRVLQDQHMLVFSLDKHLDEISHDLWQLLKPEFGAYGLILREFHLDRLVLPEDNPAFQQARLIYQEKYTREAREEIQHNSELKEAMHAVEIANLKSRRKLIDARTDAESSVIAAEAEQARRNMEGISAIQERQFETFNHMVEANANAAQNMGVMVGFGMANPAGMASDAMQRDLGEQVRTGMNGIMRDTLGSFPRYGAPAAGWVCVCGKQNPQGSDFCGKCGQPRPAARPAADWVCACGRSNPAENGFCGKCGQPRPAPTEWVCKCGRKNPGDNICCGGCGSRREA